MECFVIMPFGDKKDANGKVINFDDLFDDFIKPVIEDIGLECVRCDKIAEAGWIYSKMFDHIYTAPVAVVDITSLNPNVFYELGIRHALSACITVMIKRKGTKTPFNIQGLNVIEYEENFKIAANARKQIGDFIRNGLKSRKPDSPVYSVLNLRINDKPKKLTMRRIIAYRLLKEPAGKRICLVTGDLENLKFIADIWVSSENTNMQMSRHYERSVSGVIRYLGAKRGANGRVIEDTIAKELEEIVGENASVDPATGMPDCGRLSRIENPRCEGNISCSIEYSDNLGEGYRPIFGV